MHAHRLDPFTRADWRRKDAWFLGLPAVGSAESDPGLRSSDDERAAGPGLLASRVERGHRNNHGMPMPQWDESSTPRSPST